MLGEDSNCQDELPAKSTFQGNQEKDGKSSHQAGSFPGGR